MAFGDEDQRSKLPFFVISLQEYIPSTQLITTDVNLHHLAEVIFARFFRYKITLPPPTPSMFFCLEGSYCAQLTCKEWEVMLYFFRVYLYKLSISLLQRRVFSCLTFVY